MESALAVPTPSTALAVCQTDGINEILNLGKACVRKLVMDKVDAMLRIEAAIVSGMSQQNAVAAVAKAFTGRRGFSYGNLQNSFFIWRDGGQKRDSKGRKIGEVFKPRDWRIFKPDYNNGCRKSALNSPELIAFVRQRWADTCREDATGNALQARILDEWYSGKPIPTFGTIREFAARRGMPVPSGFPRRSSDYPQGLSVSNILRMLPRSRATRALVQRGEHAAHDFWGDQLLRDRSKLMPLQLITLDDVRCDIRVIMELPGRQAQIVYPEAVFAIDVATGLIIGKGVVGHYLRAEDGDGGKAGTKRGIQEADTRFVILDILGRLGIPQDWQMRILLENASASISNEDETAFEKLTGIKIENTGLVHRKLIESGFQEQGGMPWQKGWIESFYHLLHTTTNHLPGTVGRRYDLTAGDRDAAANYALSICRKALSQGKEIAELDLPILTMRQYHDLLDEYVVRLNWRTEHHLQGFGKVYEVELNPGEWARYDDPRAEQLLSAGARLVARMEAPAERFRRLMRGHRLLPVHPRQLMPLALDKRPVTVRAGKITIQRSGQDNLVFYDVDSAESLDTFDGREKALIGFLATDQSCIHLFTNDADLRYVASPRNVRRIDLTDHDAILCRAGEVDRGRNRIRDSVAELLAPRETQYAAMRANNDAVLGRSQVGEAIASAENSNRAAQAKERAMTRTMRRQLEAQSAILAQGDEQAANTSTNTFDPTDLL